MLRAAAHQVKALLDELGVVGYPKTTGNRGIHVYLRLEPRWDPIQVRAARSRSPASSRGATPTSSPMRGGRKNAASASSSTSTRTRRTRRCSARGRSGPATGRPGSTPFTWDELDAIDPDALTIATVPARVAANGDPWADIDTPRQSLEPLLEMHERDLANGLSDAPWPPVYPKMPGEPPRVAPSRAKKTK